MTRDKEARDSLEQVPGLDRRTMLNAALGAIFGVGTLSGCAPPAGPGVVRNALSSVPGILTVTWIGTVPDDGTLGDNLRNLVGAAVGDLTLALGFWNVGDAGGGVFFWDDDTTTADDFGTVIVPSPSVGWTRTGCWKRLFDGHSVSVAWFGARGDGVSDNHDAFTRATHALNPVATSDATTGSYVVTVPTGRFAFASTLQIDRSVVLRGTSGGAFSNSILIFPPSCDGLLLYRNDSAGPARSDGSVIQDLQIVKSGSGGTGGHGIHMKSCSIVERCVIANFAGDGVHIEANVKSSAPCDANGWAIRSVMVQACNNGLYIGGGDANGGVAVNFSAYDNRQWAIWDSSFLGNTFVGCLAEHNGLADPTAYGAFKTDESTAMSTFIGCYRESGQINSIEAPSMLVGGINAEADTTHGGALNMDGAFPNVAPGIIAVNRAAAAPYAEQVYASLASPNFLQGTALQFGREGNSAPYFLRYHSDSGWWLWQWAASDDNVVLQFCTENAAEFSQKWGGVKPSFPNGLFLKGAGGRVYLAAGTSPPSVGTWAVGDVVFNSSPSASVSSPAGWVCVSAGPPATWQPFGEVVVHGTSAPTSSASIGDRVYNSAPTSGGYIGWVYTASGWKGFGLIA